MADLNKNELEALRILWGRGALKPAQIQADFSWPIENATLRSVLAVLLEKRLVTREKCGKAFFYQAKGSPGSVMSRMARLMAHVFSGGSAAGLIAQLIQSERLSPDEIEALRRVAAEKISTPEKSETAEPSAAPAPGKGKKK